MSADAADTQTTDASQAMLQRIDETISQLERAAEQLRSGELSADAAATVVEDCAALATEASAELERLARAQPHQQLPGQDSLL
jgi:exonuclease VII small subunit